ncbi:RNA-guided endonuclease TnpB family protein (plasmid) [Staphylococcus succinus]|uniref:RNA-guided endonuclease TnpB family protein n=1 Tax=Staphylococcus succinus TaxID=61015 RepID=UPI0011570C5A|nr:RNA-guided endonuclease TnpB family protein [Staphylococcus succinus]
MYKGVQCRIYPNKEQKQLIHMTFGHTRFIWNKMLDMLISRYKNNPDLSFPSKYRLRNLIKSMKYEYPWLKDVDSRALYSSVDDLYSAFQNLFKYSSKHPRFKSKHRNKQSYRTQYSNQNIRLNSNQRFIKLPKLGWIYCRKSIDFIENKNIKSATIKCLPSNKYEVTLIMESEKQALPTTNRSIGIDLGLKYFLITSEGKKINNQQFIKNNIQKFKREQRKLSKRALIAKQSGKSLHEAKNYQKQRIKVAKLSEKIKNQRKNFSHQLSKYIVRNYDVICIENLAVNFLIKNHKLSRAISDVSWFEFVRRLKYKAQWYNKQIIQVSRFYPSTKICSTCGAYNSKIKLGVDKWTCPKCKTLHDRDINAAKNILYKGIKNKV